MSLPPSEPDSPIAPPAPPWSSDLKTFWILVGGALGLLWGWGIVARLTPPYQHLHDFVQEWTSARNFFTGQPIYLSLQTSIPQYFGGQWQAGLMKVNAHPPASVLACLPLGVLDYATAYLTWNVLSLALLAYSLWAVMRPSSLAYSPWAILPVATFLITSNALAQQINQGQWNLALLAMLTGAWVAQRQGQFAWSGALIGAAAAMKLFPAFLGLYFVAQRQWRAVAAAAISFVLLNGLTVLALGTETYTAFVTQVLPEVAGFRDYWMNASLAGFWTKLFDPQSGHVAPLWRHPGLARLAIVASSGAIVLLTAGKVWRAQTQEERDLAFALCVPAMLLASPVTWDHYFVLLTLPLLIYWRIAAHGAWRKAALVAIILALGTVNPVWLWRAAIPGPGELAAGPETVPSVAQPVHALTVLAFQFYALLALFIFGWCARPRGAPSSVPTGRKEQTDGRLLPGAVTSAAE